MFSLLFILGLARPMDGAGSEAGGGAGTPPSASVSTPASTPGQGSTSTAPPAASTDASGQQPPASTNDPNSTDPAYGNWKALRDQRDSVQAQLQQAQTQVQQWQTISTEAQTLATNLGYTAEDFAQAFQADPIKTLQILREQQAQGESTHTPDPTSIQDLIRKEMAPVNEVINKQMTEAAMVKYNTSVTEAIKSDPLVKDAPAPVQELVKDYLDEYFAAQPEIVKAMKFKGDYAAIKDATTYITGRLHGAFSEWLKSRNAPPSGESAASINNNPAPRGTRPTLDQIINDPSVLGDQYR